MVQLSFGVMLIAVLTSKIGCHENLKNYDLPNDFKKFARLIDI